MRQTKAMPKWSDDGAPVLPLHGAAETRHSSRPTLVLDTNVVLDWLVFHEPSVIALGAVLSARQARWIATIGMRDEMMHVLDRGHLDTWTPDRASIALAWTTLAELLTVPPATQLASFHKLRCSDSDDQKFIDLAVHQQAAALLTHDRALLRLAGQARASGLAILTACSWLSDRCAIAPQLPAADVARN